MEPGVVALQPFDLVSKIVVDPDGPTSSSTPSPTQVSARVLCSPMAMESWIIS